MLSRNVPKKSKSAFLSLHLFTRVAENVEIRVSGTSPLYPCGRKRQNLRFWHFTCTPVRPKTSKSAFLAPNLFTRAAENVEQPVVLITYFLIF